MWTQLSEVNASLRAQIVRMSMSQSLGQQYASMRSPEDDGLRVELAASLARESSLGNELHTTRLDVQRFVSETNAQRHLSANEMNTMIEEYLRSKNEFSEVKSFLLKTREALVTSEKQAAAWKEECRLIILKGHEKEDKYEATLAHTRTEVSSVTKEMSELRASASVPPEPNPMMMMMKFATLEKERGELRGTLKKSEDQLDSFRR